MYDNLKIKWSIFGIGVFVYGCTAAIVLEHRLEGRISFMMYLAAYLLLGFPVFQRIASNWRRHRFLNESIMIVLSTGAALGAGKCMIGDALMLLFALAGILEDMTVVRSKKYIRELVDVRPLTATRKVRDREFQVDSSKLKEQNIIIVRPGERVPVDGIVTAGETTLDTQALTGETIPQTAACGDPVYGGSINLTGAVEVKVTRTYQDSTVSQIMQMVELAENEDAGKKTVSRKFLRVYVPLVVLLAMGIILIPPELFDPGKQHEWLYRGMVFLIAACPCGLMISEPLALLGGIAAAARHGVIVKGGHFLEYLVQADIFIFDKTGTLTEGTFEVTEICPVNMSEEELLELAVYAESYSNHPVAKSLLAAYGKEIDKSQIKSVREMAGLGISARVRGRNVHIGNRRMAGKQKADYIHVTSPGTVLHVIVDGEYAGYLIAEDKIREGAAFTVQWLRAKCNAILVMLTGDRNATARKVAKELDLDYAYASLMPKDKMERLEEFMEVQGENDKVVCVGDGVNDAMILKRADIGIAMGALGSDAAIQAADIVLMEDDISKIVDLVKLAQETVQVVSQNLHLAILVKIVVLTFAALGLTELWIALAADLVVMFVSVLNAVSLIKYPIR